MASAPSGSGWSPGDRVVGNPTAGCGVCRPCRRGRPSVCLTRASADFLGYRGAFCRVQDGRGRRPDPDSRFSVDQGGRSGRTDGDTLHAVRLAGVGPDDRVLVTGAGPVGLLIIAVLRAQGISDITVSEPSPVRRQQALDVGATRVVTPDTLVEPPMAVPVAEPYAVVFECSGHASADRGSPRPARLCGHSGDRRHRVRTAPDQSEPHDHLRARDHRGLQLQRRRLPAGGGPARQRDVAARVTDRTQRHSAQRGDGLHGTARPGRDPQQGDGRSRVCRHEQDTICPADQPRGDQRGCRRHGR